MAWCIEEARHVGVLEQPCRQLINPRHLAVPSPIKYKIFLRVLSGSSLFTFSSKIILQEDRESLAHLRADQCQPKQSLYHSFPFKPTAKFLNSTGSKDIEY